MDDLHYYRPPMVTATGIFLGFMLNFASHWVTTAFTKYVVRDTIVGISILLSITLLLVVLYRILNRHYPAEKEDAYYQRTLHLFIIAASFPFIGFALLLGRFIIMGTEPILD